MNEHDPASPTITLIVPVHNGQKYVGRSIRSALAQTMPHDNFEIVVINDASTDKTAQAIEPFTDRVTLLTNDTRRGLPACINAGIRAAQGQFIVRLDADDYVHREYLNVLSLFLRMNPDIDAVACDYLLVDDHENVLRRANCAEEPIGCGIMFRIEQLIDTGLYDEDFLSREDEDLRIRFEEKYAIERIALPLYRYRRHDNNMTNDAERMEKYARSLSEKHGEKAG